MDTYADDLHQLFEKLDLKEVMMVGHSTGGGEVARFLGRHGTSRVSKAVLVSAVTPGMLKTDANPDGVPLDVFDSFRAAMVKDRAQFFIDVPSGPFFGFNRPNAQVSQGKIWSWWQQGMQCGFKAAYDCIKAFSETDTTEDLRNADIPILVSIHPRPEMATLGPNSTKLTPRCIRYYTERMIKWSPLTLADGGLSSCARRGPSKNSPERHMPSRPFVWMRSTRSC